MTHTKLTILAFSVSALTACGVEPDLGGSGPKDQKLVYDHTTDGVKGSYQQDGQTLKFHFERLANDAMHVTLESRDGFVLVDALVGRDSESTSILGAYHVDGVTTKVHFAANALSDLEAMPEMQLVPALERSLLAHGIDISQLVPVESSLGPILCPTAEPVFDVTEASVKQITRK